MPESRLGFIMLQFAIMSNRFISSILLLSLCVSPVFAESSSGATRLRLSEQEASEVGHKVWMNECGGRVDGLTSWNVGEEFPSLGIGHFIWYPEGVKGPFVERFPDVVKFLKAHGAEAPDWLKSDMACPWKSREEFLQDQQTPKMIALRKFLSSTVALQTDYLVQRLESALPKMLEKSEPANRDKIRKQFERVLKSGSAGAFELIDYVNFKGEGVAETERYNGQGWGMLQVLELMDEKSEPVQAFSEAAKAALTRRVQNSPPARHEARWLPGWTKRVNAYVTGAKN